MSAEERSSQTACATAATSFSFADFDPLAATLPVAGSAGPPSSQGEPKASASPCLPDEAPAAAAAAVAGPQLPSRSRSRRRRRAVKNAAPCSGEAGLGAGAGAGVSAAPWDDNPEAEAAERREDAKKALREAIKAKRAGRTGKQALQARAEAASESGAHQPLAGASAAEGPSPVGLPQGLNAQMVQAMMKSAGMGGAAAPSMRKLRRMMANMPEAYLMAKAAGAK